MLVMISIALAIGIYFGLKRVLWSSGTITTIALHMGCEVTQSNFFATYNRAYMYASLVWFIFGLGGWLVFAGIFTLILKLSLGFAVISAYLWVRGNLRK